MIYLRFIMESCLSFLNLTLNITYLFMFLSSSVEENFIF